MDPLDPTVTAVLLAVAFVLSCVACFQARATSVIAWAATIGFFALAWDALAAV